MSEIFSYDAVPYPSKIFLQTHPDRLASLATLFGMNPPNVENCRVLELGCGNGFNLISHAYHLPETKFVGTDLAHNHIETATDWVRELGLRNIEFYQTDVMEMSAGQFGKFDYIIAHGLFSWVPDFVRAKVLALCREMLSENGIGYISYNAYPGMHHRRMAQKMMRYHAAHFEDADEKANKSTAFLAFAAENTSDREICAPILRAEFERIETLQTSDIYHDNLAEINQPFYFHEFAELLRQNDLQYLAEADLQKMGVQNLSEDAQQFVASIDDVIEREQYLDFLRGRIFRQTLFCRREIELDRNPPPASMNKFLVASSVRPVAQIPELTSDKLEKFIGGKDSSIEINHSLTKAALVHLSKLRGRVIAFPELLETAKEKLEKQGFRAENWSEEYETVSALFLRICRETGLIGLHVFQPAAETRLSEKPRASALARWQASQANTVVTKLNLSVKIDDPISRHLLNLLDGTRTREQVFKHLSEFIRSSGEIENKQIFLKNLPNALDERLKQFARAGMFES